MTDDIVARLLNLNPWENLRWPEVLREGADEIERLRAALLKISKLEPDGCLSTDSLTVVYAAETARAALEGEKK